VVGGGREGGEKERERERERERRMKLYVGSNDYKKRG
jgi:hypothetical protein